MSALKQIQKILYMIPKRNHVTDGWLGGVFYNKKNLLIIVGIPLFIFYF